MGTTRKMSSFLLRLYAFLVFCASFSVGDDLSRSIIFVNNAGVKIKVYWVNSETQERILMTAPEVGLYDGAQMPLDTYVGHQFEIREIPKAGEMECSNQDNVCHITNFFVSETDSTFVLIKPGLEVLVTKEEGENSTNNTDNCRQWAMESLASDPENALNIYRDLERCVEMDAFFKFKKDDEEIGLESNLRTQIADLLENYTCADETTDSSPDISTHDWIMPDATRKVHVKHDRPASKIHVVENFISREECLAMETEAAKTLHRATVADGKGGSELSPHRKAMQAGITVEWEKEAEGDLIAQLSRRVYDYTEHVLKLGIQEHGQEDLMSIQYFGRGLNDTEPDRYTPHCDGDCNGLPHRLGNRMATMVMYCDLPTRGGSTNFRNSLVHIKPVVGNAIFFSYMDPATKVMDAGYTEHSGCPVYEGEKKIVTQWIRYGVDDDNPWDSFNTLGIKVNEDDYE